MQLRITFLITLVYSILPLKNNAQEQHRRIFLEEFPSISSSHFILYYTPIKENIFHPKSIFFVDTLETGTPLNPFIDQLPSLSAILINDQRQMLARITFQQYEHNRLITIEEYESGKTYLDTIISNKIPYPRAEELKTLQYPIGGSEQSKKEVQQELSKINQQYKLYALKPSQLYIPTQNEINDAFLYFSYEFSKDHLNNLKFWEEKCYEWGEKGYDFGVNEINVLFLIFEYLNPHLSLDEDLKNCILQGFNDL